MARCALLRHREVFALARPSARGSNLLYREALMSRIATSRTQRFLSFHLHSRIECRCSETPKFLLLPPPQEVLLLKAAMLGLA